MTPIHVLSYTEEAITSFLSYYRRVFPDASITVKMHLLEDHMGGVELVLG